MRAIGIDLGTSNATAAIGGPQPRTLPNRDNGRHTPSVVSFYVPRGKTGERKMLVGRAATINALRDPANTASSVKRLMGQDYGEVLKASGVMAIDDLRREFGYRFAPPPPPDAQDQGLRVLLGEVAYSPTQLSAMILRQVKEDAEVALGEAVTHAVITVPAYFTERQRAATKAAGIEAGLEVLEIINEPTAAALAYGLGRESERRCVLVFDLGGGTCDVSAIQMTGGMYVQLAIEGNNWLGGDDFDLTIVRRILAAARAEYGDLSADPTIIGQAKAEAERTKWALTSQDQVEIRLFGGNAAAGGPVDLELTLTREEFEADIGPLVDRAMDLVDTVLAKVPDELITDVLLVGGSTAVPLVQKAVIERFGAGRVRRTINPMECVALGAGIKASRYELAGGPAEPTARGSQVLEQTARHLGIAVAEGTNSDRFVPVIPKDTPYPLTTPKTLTLQTTAHNQTQMGISVYEGMSERASENEFQGEILIDLPRGLPVSTPVEVSFDYDRNRMLQVQVRVVGTGQVLKHELRRRRPAPLASGADQPADNWREDLDWLVRAGKHFQNTYREYMTGAEQRDLDEAIRGVEQRLVQDSPVEAGKASNALNTIILQCGVASVLFLAERCLGRYAIPPDIATHLRKVMDQLRVAHSEQRLADTAKFSEAIQQVVAHVIEQNANSRVEDAPDSGPTLRGSGGSYRHSVRSRPPRIQIKMDRPLPADPAGVPASPDASPKAAARESTCPAPLDRVHFSVTSPQVLSPGSAFVIDVWAHLSQDRERVIAQAREQAGGEPIRIHSKGPIEVTRGVTLTVSLRVDRLVISSPEDTILWTGEVGNATFAAEVPSDTPPTTLAGVAVIRIGGLQVARVAFVLQVGPAVGGVGRLAAEERVHRKAFVSYAHRDRDDVLARVKGIQKAAPGLQIFLDVLNLRSGENWAERLWAEIPANDVFYLFWSEHARASEWVEKEWRCALARRGLDFIDPVPLAPPDVVPPPPELAGKHFNDWVLAFLRPSRHPA